MAEAEKQIDYQAEAPEDTGPKFKARECQRIAWLGSLKLMAGDLVEVVVRGRVDQKLSGKFWCYSAEYGWLWLKTEDNDVIVKVKDVKMLRKLKR